MNELIEYAQSIISYLEQNGSNLDVQSQQALGSMLENILQIIQQQESPVDGLQPQVEPAEHASSNINAFKYDPKSGRLLVKFQDKYPSENGPVYSYDGVPKFIYDVFAKGGVAPKTSGSNAWHTWKEGVTPSHGAAMNALIKAGGYPYRRMS